MTSSDIQPSWSRLLHVARELIRQVDAGQTIIDRWTFGGGTAMMLQIDHRESHDIDIFLSDPQTLAFLDPAKRDFVMNPRPTDYGGDGSTFLKLAFQGIGEIDFIVAGSLTAQPVKKTIVEGEALLLETIPEIIAKKIYHRGSSIRTRDIFDIAAGSELHAQPIIQALQSYKNEVLKAVSAMDRLNPEFVARAITQLAIKPKYESVATRAYGRAREVMRAALS